MESQGGNPVLLKHDGIAELFQFACSLMASEVQQFPMYLLVICASSKCVN